MLSAVKGHERVKNVLTVSHSENRVGHAYIFEGPRGVGRMTLAREFAALLLCENPEKGEACGVCKSCVMHKSGNHPDFQVITNQLYDATKKTTDVLVDTVRNMKKDIYIKPFASERKIYVMPNADTMNVYAQNSLLKVLEEPPEYCTIILLAENANGFLPTILSRTVTLKLFPVPDELVKEHLFTKYPNLGEKTVAVAVMSGGCIGRAELLAESEDAIALRDETFEYLGALADRKHRPIYDLMLFLKRNKDEFGLIGDIIQGFFMDLMHIKHVGNADGIANVDKLSIIERTASKINSDAPVRLLEILLKYKEYFLRNISFAQISQCMSLEFWEVIND